MTRESSRVARVPRRAVVHIAPIRPPNPSVASAVEVWQDRFPRPWAVDLFCGAGGLSLGLQQAGFSVVGAADSDADAIETHAGLAPGLTWHGDLTTPDGFISHLRDHGITSVDLVAGGPPCQPFSRAGAAKIRDLVKAKKRPANDDRVDLWRSFLKVVDTLRPRAVLMENVPDIARWDDGSVLLAMMQALRTRGFTVDVRILAAGDFGVPQHRARLFLVGLRSGAIAWPRKRQRVCVADAISDLPAVPAGQVAQRIAYLGPRTRFQRAARRGVRKADAGHVFDHVTRPTRTDDHVAFTLLKPGGTYTDLPQHLRRYRSDIFKDKYNRLDGEAFSRTITAHIAKDGYWYIHPSQPRTLSVREAARLQTFPDAVRFAGSFSAQFRQIGNAVPPALAKAVGLAVRRAVSTPLAPTRRRSSFSARLAEWHKHNYRDFAWRRESQPWIVLLAELCLRRTRAAQVDAIFPQLIDLAPNPRLALRREKAVRSVLERLGLRWRADDIFDCAQAVVARHRGIVPVEESDLLALPGVGSYVANAVRCFAFGRPSALFDTNTHRITSRVTGRPHMTKWETRLRMFSLAPQEGPTKAFNLALLDLAAAVCTASSPACSLCPIADLCVTGQQSGARPARTHIARKSRSGAM